MRLLKSTPDGDIQLVTVAGEAPPPYAILSHTWDHGQEVTYNELVTGSGKSKSGYAKICFCLKRAAGDGIEYAWVDTCCIDKSDPQELQTAINSMFRWYQKAKKCYVYLSDVEVPDEVSDAQAFRITWAQAFHASKWFTRGWTLQELLAPASVEFFSVDCKRLGSRISLEQDICEVTGIPTRALRGEQRLTDFSVEERMSWAARRSTTVKEDKVYCLLGIFDVFLPLIYGEGEAYAESRLRSEIRRRKAGSHEERVQDLPISSLLPCPRNELFSGRESELQSLEQFLWPTAHRRTTVYGLGGCGKSALVIELAYRVLARDAGHLVFWVPAISRESFELAYRQISVCLGVRGITDDNADVKKLVRDALSLDSGRHWLMIVDNADDPDVLTGGGRDDARADRLIDYLPTSDRGKIIFTTRSRKAAGSLTQSSVMELRDMGKAEARELLKLRIAKQALLADAKAVDELLEQLVYLPLAIVQAAAFINNNDVSVSDYISLFRDTGAEAELFGECFEDPSRYREMDSTVARTWHISFDQIQKQDAVAAEYLSFMACIDRINIPRSLLLPCGSIVQQAKALGTLKGYAFITERQQASSEVQSEQFFDMHRLVHMALEWWLDGHGERTSWITRAAARIKELLPYGGHEKRDVWTRYLSHAMHVARSDGVLDEIDKAALLSRIGRCQSSLGQYSAAERTLRQVLFLREKNLGKKHERTLATMNEIGIALDSQGKYKAAEAMYRRAIEIRREILGSEHQQTLSSMSNLALVLYKQGNYTEAEAMNRQTLAICEKVLGREHPYTLISMGNLASMLGMQGNYIEAEAMNRKTLAIRKKVLGREHPDTLTSMGNLALVLSNQGNYTEAEAMNRKTLAIRKKVLRREHPDTLTSMGNLALVLYKQGNYTEAEAMNRKTLAIRKKVLRREHPNTLTSMGNLALVLYKQGNYTEAEAMNRQTLAISEKVLGSEHPDTLMSAYWLASILRKQHRYDEAGPLYQRACAGLSKVLGPDHRDTVACRRDYSAMLESQEQHRQASSSTVLCSGARPAAC